MGVLAVVFSFILAWITYQFVEKKIRFNKNHEIKLVSSLLGLLLIVLLFGLGLSQNKINGRLDGPEFENIIESKYNWNELNADHSVMINEADHSVTLKGQTEKTVLLLGDSHMAMYLPRFEVLYSQKLLPRLTVHYVGIVAGMKGLNEWVDKAASDSKVVKVVLSYYWDAGGFYSASTIKEVNIEFEKALKLLISAKKKVVMVSSVPNGEVYSPMYLVDRIKGRVLTESEAPKYSVKNFINRYQATLQPLIDIAKDLGVEVIDPVKYLCSPEGICPTTVNGDSIYFDSHHIRPKYVKQMKWLDNIILEK